MNEIFKDREKLAVRLANLAGLRWDEMDDSRRRHYFAAADRQIDWHEKTKGMDEPRLMPPFDF